MLHATGAARRFFVIFACVCLVLSVIPTIALANEAEDAYSDSEHDRSPYYALTNNDIEVVPEEGNGVLYASDEICVTFAKGTTIEQACSAMEDVGLCAEKDQIENCLAENMMCTATISSDDTVRDVLASIKAEGSEIISYAQANYIYDLDNSVKSGADEADTSANKKIGGASDTQSTFIDDTYKSELWHLEAVDAYDAWDLKRCDKAVSVAIIDTGIDAAHDDLQNQIISTAGYNSAYDHNGRSENDYADLHGHGTHVAGIVAAEANNACGVAGVSYNANIIPINASFDDGGTARFYTSDLCNAYEYLLTDEDDDGISDFVENYNLHVINMSLGALRSSLFTTEDTQLFSCIDSAYEEGILTVCSAGNDSSSALHFPSDYEKCMSVISLNSNFEKAASSNFGVNKDISAPGSSIYSTYLNNSYATMSGTSMAAPVVSGIAALVFAEDSSLNVAEVWSILLDSAVDLGEPGFDNDTANGCVNAYSALSLARDGVVRRIIYGGTESNGDTLIEGVNWAVDSAHTALYDEYLMYFSDQLPINCSAQVSGDKISLYDDSGSKSLVVEGSISDETITYINPHYMLTEIIGIRRNH